jgi:hypothetical protein
MLEADTPERVTLGISEKDRWALEKWAVSGFTGQHMAKRTRPVLVGAEGASISDARTVG